ncbi:glycosyltransferase family 2 protein [Parvibaculum sp. MBR-TMA-1.3b-4.2]
MRRKWPLLGTLALRSGLVSRRELDPILAEQRRSGSRIGDVLMAEGKAGPDDIGRLVARQNGVPFVDLEEAPPDSGIAGARTEGQPSLDFCIAHQCLPWRRRNGKVTWVAADPSLAKKAVADLVAGPFAMWAGSARQIRRAIEALYADELTERAVRGLMTHAPQDSAAMRLSPGQCIALPLLAAGAALLTALYPQTALAVFSVVLSICFLAVSALRGVSILLSAAGRETAEELAYERHGPGPVDELPVYTIMVPLFREANVLPPLTDALKRLNYPPSKLDIKLIFEACDAESYEAAKALNLPGHFDFIRVPESAPQTKPKACNFALPFARGEYLVIYDAEDLPEPNQLLKAVAAFRLNDPKLACLQAQLNYYNWSENWLTRQFAIEYASFFDLMLPMLVRLGLPIPLGGTSTHFRTDVLREVSGWDPHNVTEDADLGIRLATRGYRCGIIRSTTEEEANCRLHNWVRQRSRWIKGWLQTWLVRMRHPVSLCRSLGPAGFLGFQLVIGGFTLATFAHPFFYIVAGGIIAAHGLGGLFGAHWLTGFNLSVLISGYSLSILAGMIAAKRRGRLSLMAHTLTMPAYWMLISAAAVKAVFQLLRHPFYWEKTVHGLSRMAPPSNQSIISLADTPDR